MSATGRRRPGPTSGVGVALLVLNVAQVPGFIRSTDNGTDRGRAVGYGLALAVGASSSALARTPWPFLGTVAMCLLMLHLHRQRAFRDPAEDVR
jgi:hypothetical protein